MNLHRNYIVLQVQLMLLQVGIIVTNNNHCTITLHDSVTKIYVDQISTRLHFDTFS